MPDARERAGRSWRTLVAAVLVGLFGLLVSVQVKAEPPSAPSDLRVGGFPGEQIRVAWSDNALDETSYRIERSIDDQSGYDLLTTVASDTEVYTDTTVAADTTYWYRVQACNSDGCSDYSKDSYNISFAAGSVPNLNERYMLFLINESRADPAAWGQPSYAPRPPVAYNSLLNYAAHSHSQAILNSDFSIGHCYPTDPDDPTTEYRCPSERARDVGYSVEVSENLIAGGGGWEAAETAHQAFMDSDAHRANILDESASEAGMGHSYDPDKGDPWHGQFTQTFSGSNPVTIPALPSGLVVPYWGREPTEFAFMVNFYNESGTGPALAQVVIDGVAHLMALRHGTTANGSYVYTTTLDKGTHGYYFYFEYGSGQSARLPASGTFSGPEVEVGAAVLEVPAEYPTLAEALAYSEGDVIVRLAKGIFYETTPIEVPRAGIWIEGAGMMETVIQGDGSGNVLEVHVDTLIRDLTITGSGLDDHFESGIWTTSGRVEVHNCRLVGNSVGLFSFCYSPACGALVTVRNSLFDYNVRAAIDANQYATHRLVNVTVVQNGSGVILNNASSVIENSIIVHNSGEGLVGNDKDPIARYNNVWGNGWDYSGLEPGVGDISADPLFEDEVEADYRLQFDSPCFDAGNPGDTYSDRDGSRNDLGIYGGPDALVAVNSRASAPSLSLGPFLVRWQGYATDGLQDFDIQYRVGTDGAWTDWLTGTAESSVDFGPTEPVSLTVETTYFFRSRARDLLGNVEEYPAQADAETRVIDPPRLYLPIIAKGQR